MDDYSQLIERDPYGVPDGPYQGQNSVPTENGEKWQKLRQENLKRQAAAKHIARSHTA